MKLLYKYFSASRMDKDAQLNTSNIKIFCQIASYTHC